MAAYLWFVQLQTTNGRLFTYGTNYTIYGWWLRLLHLMARHKWHSKVLELQFMISVWSLVHGCRVLAYVLPSYCWWGFYQVWLIMLMRQYTVTNLVCHDQVGKSVVSVHSDYPQDDQSPDWCYHYSQTTLLVKSHQQLLKRKRKQRNLIMKVSNLILRLNNNSLNLIEFDLHTCRNWFPPCEFTWEVSPWTQN